MGQSARKDVRRERGQRSDQHDVGGGLVGGVDAEEGGVVVLELFVDGVEEAWEGDVSDQGDFYAGGEAGDAFFGPDLAEGVSDPCILLKPNNFHPCLDDD